MSHSLTAKAAAVFAITAMLCALNLQWGLLQCVAWATMLPSYYFQTESVSTAVSMTFDGDHPCTLCKTVDQAIQSNAEQNAPEKASLSRAPLGLLTLLVTSTESLQIQSPFLKRHALIETAWRGSRRTQSPQTPPPRRSA